MPDTPKLSWTEAELNDLIGEMESIRREFKSGRMFDNEPENKWITNLSREVSALANTVGGELFLGIDEERKSKSRVAASIDGVPVALLEPERLQRKIESSVSPYLPGIRVQRVRLSSRPDRVVFVIRVPQGSTAYQANDGRYYGRSEFEVKYLPDHEVRLRMSRGRIARGIILAGVVAVDFGVARETRMRAEAEAKRAEFSGRTKEPIELEIERRNPDGTPVFYDPNKVLELLSAQLPPDVVNLDFLFRNDGELTIRAPAVEFRETRNKKLFDEGLMRIMKSVPTRLKLEDAIIYPGDEQAIDARLSVECKRDTVFASGDYTLSWKVFLDNSPASFGEIDLASLIETTRRQSVGDR
jgi:hypothetical protein